MRFRLAYSQLYSNTCVFFFKEWALAQGSNIFYSRKLWVPQECPTPSILHPTDPSGDMTACWNAVLKTDYAIAGSSRYFASPHML